MAQVRATAQIFIITPQVSAVSVVEAERGNERVAGWRSEWSAHNGSTEAFRWSAGCVIRYTT